MAEEVPFYSELSLSGEFENDDEHDTDDKDLNDDENEPDELQQGQPHCI